MSVWDNYPFYGQHSLKIGQLFLLCNKSTHAIGQVSKIIQKKQKNHLNRTTEHKVLNFLNYSVDGVLLDPR